jgi:hypothetical protein
MDMDKVRQLYAVRNAIETLAIRAVAFKHTKADIEKVRQLIEVMTLHARASDLRSLSDVELNFHEAVRQIAGNHYVEKIVIRVAAAQMGATQKADQRAHTLHRMLDLLEGAAAQGAKLVVFPELAFTTFFPRWLIDDPALDAYFEGSMPNPAVQPLFDRRERGVGSYVGYAEITCEGRRFNS